MLDNLMGMSPCYPSRIPLSAVSLEVVSVGPNFLQAGST